MILAVSIPVAVTQSPHGPQWWAITAIFVGLALLIFVFVLKALVQTWAEEERIRRARHAERERSRIKPKERCGKNHWHEGKAKRCRLPEGHSDEHQFD